MDQDIIIKQHNFGAGPCILPECVMAQAAAAVKNWNGMGLSILEVSHRSAEFECVMIKTQLLVRELLNVPDSYSVLFLTGGASTQFSMIPMNFLNADRRAAYLDSGFFSLKAIKEAQYFGQVDVLGSSVDKDYSYIADDFPIPADAAYFHCTSNNTIEGTQMFRLPDTLGIPLVCDMSSDIFSRMVNVKDFSLIYAGAQKNMGPAGMTLVIVKNEFLERAKRDLPAMWDYKVYRDHNSTYNTPPVFPIYVAMLNLLWLKQQGGVAFMEHQNRKKSALLYAEIDRNPLFYGLAQLAHRSRMNVTFRMHDRDLEEEFMEFATTRGIVGIRGYKPGSGFRASLYNALPLSSVEFLMEAMKDFAAKKALLNVLDYHRVSSI